MYTFYILSSKCTTWNRIDSDLVARYKALLRGEIIGRPSTQTILDLVTAVHVVHYADDCRALCCCNEYIYIYCIAIFDIFDDIFNDIFSRAERIIY